MMDLYIFSGILTGIYLLKAQQTLNYIKKVIIGMWFCFFFTAGVKKL